MNRVKAFPAGCAEGDSASILRVLSPPCVTIKTFKIMAVYFSPRQVAQSLGVSESSLKRWCDRGVIDSVRTPGGHRKLPKESIVRFVRHHGRRFINPEAIGLPPAMTKSARVSMDGAFTDALTKGDLGKARQIVFDLFLANNSVAQICDDYVAPAMEKIGELWSTGQLDVYQEHHAVEIVFQLLQEICSTLPVANDAAPLAIGAAVEGDVYALPTKMIEVSLIELGWRAVSVGPSLPFKSLASAIDRMQPRLVWLSASKLNCGVDFAIQSVNELYDGLQESQALVIGGKALDVSIRRQMRFSTYGDNMQQLCNFARTLYAGSAPSNGPTEPS